jgi:hypothetical protein
MALVTRASVLEQLGIADSTTDAVVFTIAFDESGGATSALISVSDGSVTVNVAGGDDSGINGPFLSATYPTTADIVAALNALDGITAAAQVAGSEPWTPTKAVDFVAISAASPIRNVVYAGTGVSSELTSYIDTLIGDVEARAARMCGRSSFESVAVTEEVEGGTVLEFSTTPVTAVTSIQQLDNAGSVVKTLSASDYNLNENAGIAYASGGSSDGSWTGSAVSGVAYRPARNRAPSRRFASGQARYKLTYTGGYTTSTVPDDLVGVLRQHVVDRLLARTDSRSLASGSIVSSSKTARTPAEMDEMMRRDLAPWTRPGVVI